MQDAALVGGVFSALIGLIALIIVIAFMISVSGNLRAIRDQAERQTGLLEEIARRFRPKVDPAAKRALERYDAIQPQRLNRELIVGAGIILVIVLIAAAIASRK